tara:strand:- start:314 stop:1177 length:864 start_codon:yes stop_codon:yes gene_type:complete
MSNEKEYNDTMLISARTNDNKDNVIPLHYKDTNFVFIGYDSREDIAYRVCEHSLIRHSSRPLTVIDLEVSNLRRNGDFTREWREDEEGQRYDVIDDKPFSTEFSHTRFLAPHIAKKNKMKNWIMFCDCDFLFLEDVDKLFKYVEEHHPNKAAACVKFDWQPTEDTKMDNQKQLGYDKKLWSSLMLLNMSHKDVKKLDADKVNTMKGLDLHQFKWTSDSEIGDIPSGWNHIPEVSKLNEKIKAIHFSLGGPWFGGKYKNMQFAQDWEDEKLLYRNTLPERRPTQWINY